MKKYILAVATLGIVGIFVFAIKISGNIKVQTAQTEFTDGISETNLTKIQQEKLPMQSPSPQPADSLFVPILVYHHIGTAPARLTPGEKSLFIKPEWFENHMKFLSENGFQSVLYSDLAAYFEKGTPLPLAEGKRPVMIDFDDGWDNTAEVAWPIMKKYGMTGTVFVITNLVDHRGRLTWEQIKQIHREGMEIGSHTVWHPYLTKSLKAKFEIEESKRVIEEKLGTKPNGEQERITAFAYPYGAFNQKIEELVRAAGYKVARSFTNGRGINRENLFHVPVVRVYANDTLARYKKLMDL